MTYMRYEVLRVLRSRRFFFLALGFPVVLYYLIAGPNRHEQNIGSSGLSFSLYYMVGLAAFGTMNAMLSTGARIAAERATGWNRQLRITPLSTSAYFRAKIIVGYLMCLLSLATLYIAGATLGVSLPAKDWIEMTIYILIGLIPFAALGILIGHLIGLDSIGPAMGGTTALLGLLGGVWFPIGSDGFMHDIAILLPSYWLVQASHVAIGGDAWRATGWIVVGAWTICVALAAVWAYRRDTSRY